MDNSELLIMPNGDGGTPPDSNGGTPPDSNGGNSSSSSSVSWSGATEITSAATVESPTYTSTSSGQNAVLINTSEAVVINNPTVTKSGGDSAGDNESFYGTNSAVMVKGGTSTTINGGTVTTDAAGANGVFSYGGNGGTNGATGDGTTVNISNVNITTTGNGSGGIMTTGGGKTVAQNLTINTSGQSSAAIRTDRGGGNVTVTGGSYTSNGLGSPAIYSTADIIVNDATLTSNLSEGVCIEGLNSVTLNNCTLTANNTQTNGQATFLDGVMIYQSMSGDSAEGTSTFTMNGGTLTNKSGHVFHVTNTSAVINLNGVTINNEDSNGVLLSVSSDGWSGASNVATLNASGQTLNGNILVGNDSTLTLNLTNGATFNGIIGGNITNASGSVVSSSVGTVNLTLDTASKLYLNGDTYVTAFSGDAANVVTNGYNFYVNNSVLEGTTVSDNSVSSALVTDFAQSLISASSTFSGTINLNEHSNIKNVDASATSQNVVIIGNAQDNSIMGSSGNSSIYGAAGNDTLTGSTARDQFWFMGDGNATVTNFVTDNDDTSDVVTFYNVGLSNVSRDNSTITFTANTGATFNLQTTSNDGNDPFFYSLDGQNIYGAKVGGVNDESLTFESGVNFYQVKGEEGNLYVIGDDSYEIKMYEGSGQYYVGINNIIAYNGGNNLIVGDANSNLIVGGSGNNSLWGGAGSADDVLQGGSGSNQFWYGNGEGNDNLINMKQGDVVNLYNINLSDLTSASIDTENVNIAMTSGNTLRVGYSGEITPTFQLATGEKYNYNRSSATWQSV